VFLVSIFECAVFSFGEGATPLAASLLEQRCPIRERRADLAAQMRTRVRVVFFVRVWEVGPESVLEVDWRTVVELELGVE
jgi:hypothetical protein